MTPGTTSATSSSSSASPDLGERYAFAIPDWYPELLDAVADRARFGRQRALAAANQRLVQTYWAVGNEVLARQSAEGWGARVIDRLSADLRKRFPDATGFSPRNLKYMRAFAEAWPDEAIVQRSAAQLPWRHNMALLDKLDATDVRLWYCRAAVEHGWSRDVLVHHIESRFHERAGKAITNFDRSLPPPDSDLAQQATRDPYLFDFVGIADLRRERALVMHSSDTAPIGVAEWTTAITASLPAELESSLPTVAELEAELAETNSPVGGELEQTDDQ
ncbi:DUF1016 N-terminal domain-containing protein [Skermania piniformis]|uniref:DUF1016 family protein n=1 Tax=Skermania pinensis TaxID=39122 RepID=A0ABX8SFC8_9ACTN|nr:DUF1016 N-terminal domain-containing protein [Skermania piniformis]QXQ15664.1 DUF1016 family protein [Skermania piniformis]